MAAYTKVIKEDVDDQAPGRPRSPTSRPAARVPLELELRVSPAASAAGFRTPHQHKTQEIYLVVNGACISSGQSVQGLKRDACVRGGVRGFESQPQGAG
jgi:hypothetical protein